ncbi:hypothetical protein BSKO_13635 [Bryopsis sp. KO-2023]|nr:hypothetical protein BSKO_13635 [Bryopsis sp. KO-2023]
MFGEGPAHAHRPGLVRDQSKTSLESSATLSYAPGQVVPEFPGSQESIMQNHPEPCSGDPGATEHHTDEGLDIRRNKIYPLPHATHELVCQHASIFEDTLREVCGALGISDDRVPRIGGRDLNLHLLYKMVTSFGGCREVIRKKLWKEVSEPFNLPPTITSVSFVLRKAYITFLWDYEQIYCFRRVGRMVPPPERQRQANNKRASAKQKPSVPFQAGNTSQDRMEEDDDKENNDKSKEAKPARSSEGDAQSRRKKKKIEDYEDYIPNSLVMASSEDEDPNSISTGTMGRISVDGKFGMGYFVSTCIGNQDFKGVLYCQPAKGEVRARKKSEPGQEDMELQQPRSHRSPFKFFVAEARPHLKQSYPHLTQEGITQKLWDVWTSLPFPRRDPFIKLSTRDKQRYHLEMEAYSHRIMAQDASTQAAQCAKSVRRLQKTLVESQVPNILQPPPAHPLEGIHNRLPLRSSSSKPPQDSYSASMPIGMASFWDQEHSSEGPPSGSLGHFPTLPSIPSGLGFEASNQPLSTAPALGNTLFDRAHIPAAQAYGYQVTQGEGWIPHMLPQHPEFATLSNFGPIPGVPAFSLAPPNNQF